MVGGIRLLMYAFAFLVLWRLCTILWRPQGDGCSRFTIETGEKKGVRGEDVGACNVIFPGNLFIRTPCVQFERQITGDYERELIRSLLNS